MNLGLYPQPAAEYHAIKRKEPCFTYGIAHAIITRSALHAWYESPALNPSHEDEDGTKLDFGAAAHDVLLEGGEKIAVLDFDDWRKKAAQQARLEARLAGKVPVLSHQFETISRMVSAARGYLADSELGAGILTNGFIEHSMVWREGKLLCVGRPDILGPDRRVMVDYKSCSNAEPDAFLRIALSCGYDLQGAHYQRGNAATGGPARCKYIWLAQEVEEPFACSLVGMSPQMEEVAAQKLSYAQALWQSALERNEWRGYPARIAWVEYPEWSVQRFQEMIEMGAQG